MDHSTLRTPAHNNSQKFCTRCKRELSRSDFLPHKGSKDGLRVWCNECLIPNYVEIKQRHPGESLNRCGKCKEWKTVGAFAKDPSRANGVCNTCKACRAQWTKANSEYLTQKAMEWQRNNPERAKANIRKWEEKYPEKKKSYRKATIERYPERARARQAVRTAVYLGKFPAVTTQFCVRCGNPATEYHHWSYDPAHWLEVEPMCATCHARADQERREVTA